MNLFKSKINESAEALVKLQESYDALNDDFAKATAEITEANQLAATYKEEFARLSAENEAHLATIAELNKESLEATQESVKLDELAAMKAVEILAESGHPAVEILEDETEELDLLDTMKNLKGRELQAFYNANRKDIQAALKRKN